MRTTPLVVLPDPAHARRAATAALSDAGRIAAARTAAGLDQAGVRIRRDYCHRHVPHAALSDAVGHAHELMDLLAPAGATRPNRRGRSADNPIHAYFGVRRAALSPEQIAAQEAAVIVRGLDDLCGAPVDVNDLLREITAMRGVLDGYAAGWTHRDQRRTGRSVGPAAAGGEMKRWIVGHHTYLMFNVRAAAETRRAADELSHGRQRTAARALLAAECFTRGFTAAMGHATAIPAESYRRRIRPTMTVPQTPVPLTGMMHTEHRDFRQALKRLLRSCPDTYEALARRAPDLAAARAALLWADLIDIERHILIADTFVGTDRSLDQSSGDADNAVVVLRRMREARTAQYRDLLPPAEDLPAEAFFARTGTS